MMWNVLSIGFAGAVTFCVIYAVITQIREM